jgi:CheY-like chemotaxis protein
MKLEQVLLNICINSRDAIEPDLISNPVIRLEASCITLHADGVPQDAVAGAYVRLRVHDNGPGMDEDTRIRIFEPFFTTKDVDKGTGLGLSTALGIVQEHGGWIECDSTPGSGACFDLHLPAAGPVERETGERCRKDPRSGDRDNSVIDNEEMVRHTAIQMLERRGFHTLTAADGEAGLEIFSQQREVIDLVLLDHSMPRLSGLETLRALRQMAAELPIIIITGFPTSLEDFEGANDLVLKPFSLDGLVGHVRAALDGTPPG